MGFPSIFLQNFWPLINVCETWYLWLIWKENCEKKDLVSMNNKAFGPHFKKYFAFIRLRMFRSRNSQTFDTHSRLWRLRREIRLEDFNQHNKNGQYVSMGKRHWNAHIPIPMHKMLVVFMSATSKLEAFRQIQFWCWFQFWQLCKLRCMIVYIMQVMWLRAAGRSSWYPVPGVQIVERGFRRWGGS